MKGLPLPEYFPRVVIHCAGCLPRLSIKETRVFPYLWTNQEAVFQKSNATNSSSQYHLKWVLVFEPKRT